MADLAEKNRAQLVEKLHLERKAPSGAPQRRRWLRYAAIAGALVLVVAVFALRGGSDAPAVQTATAKAAADMPAETTVLDASGYVVARRQATVSAKITGKVTEVLIEEGMRVEEGAVLARLDAEEATAQLALTRAQLESARKELEVLRSELAQAERDAARQDSLARTLATSKQEMERARSLRDTLRARIATAQEQIRVAEENVDVAQVQLDNTEVKAPFSGVVVAKAAQPGEMISPISAGGGFTRTGIGTIVDMDSLEIEVDVGESFIGRVSPGQPVQSTLNAYPEWKIPGKVIAVVPTADRNKATIKVRVAIDAKDERIVPEMGVRVAFLSSADRASATARSGVWIPNEAVVAGEGQSAVFVLEKGKARRREVTLGESGQNDRQILGGLAAGERVILSPPSTLEDGSSVRSAESG